MIDFSLVLSLLTVLIIFEWVLKPIHALLSRQIHRHLTRWCQTRATLSRAHKEGEHTCN